MASQALNQRLFEETLDLFEGQGDQKLSAQQGAALVDGWLTALNGVTNAGTIVTWLQELRSQLVNNHPDPDRVEEILFTLAEQTSQIAQGSNVQEEMAGKLESVATALRQVKQDS
jgi:hypothetical protein